MSMDQSQQQQEEAMEVDHENITEAAAPPTGRKRHEPEFDHVDLPEPSVPCTGVRKTRRILKAKRIHVPLPLSMVLVLDTNVLLNELNSVKKLISDVRCHFREDVSKIVVPYTVINELDGLKNSKNNKRKAMNSIKFINDELKNGGQNGLLSFGTEDQERRSGKISDNNDDNILACCLTLCQQHTNAKVILVTNDINLQNKSMIHKVESKSLAELNNHTTTKTIKFKTIHTNNGWTAAEATTADHGGSPKIKQKASKRMRVISGEEKTYVNKSPPSRPSSTNTSSSADTNRSDCLDVKYQLNGCLTKLIADIFQRTYGTEWRKILSSKYDPSSASLYDQLYVMKRHWIGVFSDHFHRDRKLYELIGQCTDNAKRNGRDDDLGCYRRLLDRLNRTDG